MDETGPQPEEEVFEHEPGASYLHLWREVILTYRQLMRQVARRTDYSGAQFEVLRELANAEGRSTVSALARELSLDPAAVTRLVTELEKLGMVQRERDPADGRRRPVVLGGGPPSHERAACRAASVRELACRGGRPPGDRDHDEHAAGDA